MFFFKCLFHLDWTGALGLEVAPRLWQQDPAAEAGEGPANWVAAADSTYAGKNYTFEVDFLTHFDKHWKIKRAKVARVIALFHGPKPGQTSICGK